MKRKNVLKEINIKNRGCYYFDDIINGTKISFSDILLNKKSYENISVYSISFKTPTSPKPLRIRFDKIDGFITSLVGKIKHLVLFDYGLFDKICNKICNRFHDLLMMSIKLSDIAILNKKHLIIILL